MTDLVARLRAVNPVPTCEPPAVEAVWRRLDHEDKVSVRHAARPVSPERRRRWMAIDLLPGVRQIGLGLAVAVPVLVAALAIVLLAHTQDRRAASSPRPAHPRRVTVARMSVQAALADGVQPPAPGARLALPVLGSPGTRSLRSFRGEVVVLNVFASWCEPCRAEARVLERVQAQIAGHGATVLGVTDRDPAAASGAFVRAAHITYPVLLDVDGRLGRAFAVNELPETFVIDRRGRIVAARAGEINRHWLMQALAPVISGGSAGRLGLTGVEIKSPPTRAELAAMARAYPLLGRPQRPSDVPPDGALDPYVIGQGARLADSRRAVVTSHGESLYIVPAHRSICVVSSDRVAGGCQPFPYTSATPADVGATICSPNLPPTELEVAGLMPPGASQITVEYSNGSSRPVTATNGMIAIYARLKGPLPESIRWMSPTGAARTGTAVPPDAGATRCAS